MITNFEEITEELSETEMLLLPLMLKGFSTKTKSNPIKAEQIIKLTNESLIKNNFTYKLTGARLRKIVNYIRSKSLLPIIATSEGYFISEDKEEISKQIKSLNERANSIIRCAKGLEIYLQQK